MRICMVYNFRCVFNLKLWFKLSKISSNFLKLQKFNITPNSKNKMELKMDKSTKENNTKEINDQASESVSNSSLSKAKLIKETSVEKGNSIKFKEDIPNNVIIVESQRDDITDKDIGEEDASNSMEYDGSEEN